MEQLFINSSKPEPQKQQIHLAGIGVVSLLLLFSSLSSFAQSRAYDYQSRDSERKNEQELAFRN